jgi:hypothetical protein
MDYFHEPPELSRFTVFFVQPFAFTGEPQPSEIGHHRARLKALEYVDARLALWAEKVRSPDRDLVVRNIAKGSAF